MKIRVTITFEYPVEPEHLQEYYGASNIQEAAASEQKRYEDGDLDMVMLIDSIPDEAKCSFEGIE